jgi:CheY-like chemotaxis protein
VRIGGSRRLAGGQLAIATSVVRAIPPGLAVLLVEDDAQVRAVMRRFLTTLRCVVHEAPNGEQALLSIGAGERFDLLLSDIALGAGMRGTELAARVQRQLPDAAIVLMSGYSAELLEADSGSPPTWELLRKPCSREELESAIARVLDLGSTASTATAGSAPVPGSAG